MTKEWLFQPKLQRNHNEVSLPDHTVGGVSLSDGKLVGLTNLSRAGVAVLDERLFIVQNLCLGPKISYYLGQRKFI